MAIVKHIKSRNANYSDALDYLIFQHDESTGKMILVLDLGEARDIGAFGSTGE